MTWIKICGMTNLRDAEETAARGVNALGFIFAPSPRRIEAAVAKEIIRRLPSSVMKVGVFVDERVEEVRKIVEDCGLDVVQLHGQESPAYCRELSFPYIKAIRVKDEMSLKEMERYFFAPILLDAWAGDRAGGTGETFSWELALRVRKRRFILSGGLRPENVTEAITLLHPWGVDVCSGVEMERGKKDLSKVKKFIEEVQRVDGSTR